MDQYRKPWALPRQWLGQHSELLFAFRNARNVSLLTLMRSFQMAGTWGHLTGS